MAATPDDPQVRLLGDALPYADGAEDALLEVMGEVEDRRSGSDELAARIVDWPTRYHLTRLRANLLRPFALPEGSRVLDVGAGTGALSRYLGEQGLEVTALEGSLARAQVAAARCADLPNVEVVCGPVGELDDPDGFDVVVVCGVLEYAHAVIGGEGGAAAFLDTIRRLCKPDGALVLAIENRLGLKYLLGYAEDHLGRPWVGIEGYPPEPGVRTWSRRELGSMLAGAGFGGQRWLHPFPDYKLPTLVLRSEAYDEPDAERLVDQLLAVPTRDFAHPPLQLCDERAAHSAFVAAGLGPDVSSSLLVVAAADEARAEALVEPDVLAWRFGDERERTWLRTTRIHGRAEAPTGAGRTVTQERTHGDVPEVAERGWMRQVLVPEAPYHPGSTLEQQLRAAANAHDVDGVRAVVQRWREHLRGLEGPVPDGAEPHPYLPAGTEVALPADHLDTAPDNFVDVDGELRFIDPEWQAGAAVSAELVITRGLWRLARTFITTGLEQPWPPALTVDALAGVLGAMCGERIDDERLQAFFAAEGELQALVSGASADEVAAEHAEIGASCRLDQGVSRGLPWSRVRSALSELVPGWRPGDGHGLGEEVQRLQGENERLHRAVHDLEELIVELRGDIHRVVLHGRRVEGEVEALKDQRDRLEQDVATLTDELVQLRNRLPMKAYRGAKRGVDVVARKVRRTDG